MKHHSLFKAISLATSIAALSACSSSSTESSLQGSAFKGPVDNALIEVKDASGNLLATGSSNAGTFKISDFELADGAIFISTQNGSYTDEASGEPVSLPGNGLMTVFTRSELRQLMDKNTFIAMTPETTLLAKLVKEKMAAGDSPEDAIAAAKQLIKTQLIDGTNPAGIAGDDILMTGNLSSAIPADEKEALARNRAISYSYQAKNMNLNPSQVFEMIDKQVADLEDGLLDGKDTTGAALNITDKDGSDIDLSSIELKTEFGMARSQLMSNTINRLMAGELSDAETAELGQMGFDTSFMDQNNQANQQAAATTEANLLADNLPAFKNLPVLADEDGDPTDAQATYTLTATPDVNVTIEAPGTSWNTTMLRYNGLQLPPVIKVNRGDAMTLNLVNELDADTTIHWHGFKIPGDQDGGPDFPVTAGGSKTYQFTMQQAAASLWFHPHPDMKTGEQVYRGLAGVYLLDDAISQQLVTDKNLPASDYDIPMLIQDRRFADEVSGSKELLYMDKPMDADGMYGDDILVNGVKLPKLDVETRQYRFRIYNTSNARTYDFALHDGSNFTVIGTDGGLLETPVVTNHIMLGAAERAEIVIDFSQYSVGDKVMLISRPFNGSAMMAMSGMGGMDMSNMSGMNNMQSMNGNNASADMGYSLLNGMRSDIMRFDIATSVTDDVTLYSQLPANADIITERLTQDDADKTRNFIMSMDMSSMSNGGAMKFVINGKSFDMDRIDETITLSEGDTEIWSIRNMSPMAHPFHAHAIQWQILDRNGVSATGVDLGWKDTVLVQPGETVRFIGRFDPVVNSGDYMYHCHILEHEDAGMMGFFRIQ